MCRISDYLGSRSYLFPETFHHQGLPTTSDSLLPEHSSTLEKCTTLLSYKHHKLTKYHTKSSEIIASLKSVLRQFPSTPSEANKTHVPQAVRGNFAA